MNILLELLSEEDALFGLDENGDAQETPKFIQENRLRQNEDLIPEKWEKNLQMS